MSFLPKNLKQNPEDCIEFFVNYYLHTGEIGSWREQFEFW